MAKNVIMMVGDGMGWEMSRAGAIQAEIEAEIAQIREENPNITDEEIAAQFEGRTLDDYYTEGKGSGQSYQNLDGFALSTTGNTYIDGDKGNSALQGDPFDHNTGESEVREGFEFDPSPAVVEGFRPELRDEDGFDEDPVINENGEQVGGNVPVFNTEKAGETPWDANYYENRDNPSQGFDAEYIKNIYPDSAGTASGLYAGVKTYVGAISVDIFEETTETFGEKALDTGKSLGVVSSVPFNHATPAAMVSHVNQRNKTTELSFDSRSDFANDNGDAEDDVDEFGHPINDNDNIFRQIVEDVQPTVILGGGHPDGRGDERYITRDELQNLRDGVYDYEFVERGPDASQVLADTAAEVNPDAGERLFGIYGGRGQGGNLPWRSADGDYSRAGQGTTRNEETGLLEITEPPLEEGETVEEFIAREKNENPTLPELTSASLDVVEDDDQGFALMVEGGDIDWSAHGNDIDAMLGTLKDFNESVTTVQEWIANNGGYEENLLIVTADHDHYLTLQEDFPELLAQSLLTGEGGEELTTGDVAETGHFWGSEETVKNGWGTHTTRPVPVYYQGPESDVEAIEGFIGEGYQAYGEQVQGVDGFVDQVHLGQVQLEAITNQAAPAVGATPVFGSLEGDSLEAGIDFTGEANLAFAGAGDDLVDTSTGNGGNRSYGGSNNDELTVGSNDRAFGGEGDDLIESSLGRENRLYGGMGEDTVVAGYQDRVVGGEDSDRLFLSAGEVEGGGENTVTGGAAADQFWLANAQFAAEANVITDFTFGEDVLGIGGIDSVATFEDLTISSDGSDAVVSVGDNDLARLLGVNADDLTADQFAIQASAEAI